MGPESSTPDLSQLTSHCYVVTAEWFWLSVQKETCADEAEYLLEQVSTCRRLETMLILMLCIRIYSQQLVMIKHPTHQLLWRHHVAILLELAKEKG